MKDTANDKDQPASLFDAEQSKSEPRSIEVPSVELPKGGGAIRGIDEQFSVNAANGTADLSIPLPISPARGAVPKLALHYSSGGGNSTFGLGWSLELASVRRQTDLELPRYHDAEDSDAFVFSGAEELVPEFEKTPAGNFTQDAKGNFIIKQHDSSDGQFKIRQYRPRTEGLFARIERWTHQTNGEMKWRIITRDNVVTLLGWSDNSRIVDPQNPRNIYEWLPEFTYDDKGNCCRYIYKPEDDAGFEQTLPHNVNRHQNGQLTYTNRYLERVLYGNKTPYLSFGDPVPPAPDFMFENVFDYGEYDLTAPYAKVSDWTYREDAFSNYKPGFEVRTTRLCRRVLLFHHFNELPGGSALVKSLDIEYDTGSERGFTFLTSATSVGYIKQSGGEYTQKSFPSLEVAYQEHAWSTSVQMASAEATVQAPAGIDEPDYTFTDLYNEGLSGILSEQSGGWYYKRNLGDGNFARAERVSPKPAVSGLGETFQLLDLDADGSKQLANFKQNPTGYFELDDYDAWRQLTPFKQLPNINFEDPNTRLVDLTGDGRADLLITEDHALTWYASQGRAGYDAARTVPRALDEDQGPTVVFSEGQATVFLADMSGDGLTDIVRIRAHDVCYWPNVGYGKFGAKIAMDNPPVFDAPDAFNPAYLKLVDIDGSGTTDIVYLGKNQVTCWLNLSGNAFASEPFVIDNFPEIHDLANVAAVDLLGNGTQCLVWSSPLSKDGSSPLRYIDLMGSKKPHLMIGYKNNFGKEVSLEYKPSTAFYLEAQQAGRPWATKLHFPVHCIFKTETVDRITGHQFVSSYGYHHGYYDHAEREFRGFGMVEQTDAEHFEHWAKSGASNVVAQELHQEPVVTRQWFHTGAFLQQDAILSQFSEDYWYAEMERQGFVVSHNEHELPPARVTVAADLDAALLDNLSAAEQRQAARAYKSQPLRSEMFAFDAPESGASPDQLQTQLTPYTVKSNSYTVQLLQPKGQNRHAVFAVKESQSIDYSYERDLGDPRIAHTINVALDEYSNVLESAQIVYPRTSADPALPLKTQAAQAATLITYTEHHFTNDVQTADTYRLRQPSEEKTYELRGVAKSGDYYMRDDFTAVLSSASEVSYQQKDNQPASGSPEKRLIEHVRILYYKDDLSGSLDLHQLESQGLEFESYQLAYTPALLTDIFAAKATAAALNEGKFVHSQGDSNWWIRSGVVRYLQPGEAAVDARNRFWMPVAFVDPFGATTLVTYLADFTFIDSTEDALGNQIVVETFNFRTLKPSRLRDINDNLSEVVTDELGLVKATALFGKGSQADNLSGYTEFTTVAENGAVASFFDSANSTELVTRGKSLLARATSRFVYDFSAYQTSGQPAVTATITREEHDSQSSDSAVQLSFTYLGGLGTQVMIKNQAEPGLAKQLTLAPDDSFVVEEVDTGPELRWIGTGRTAVNNKGKPVKQYEPYFSVTHGYEDNKELVESGVTPLMYYDAPGRLIRILMPNDTLSRISYFSWKQVEHDACDTVLDSVWHHERSNSLINAELLADGKDPAKEKQAADASAKHAETPKTQHFDALKRPVLLAEHNRDGSGVDEVYLTQVEVDIEGNLVRLIDPRGNVSVRHKYDMLGNLVYQHGMNNGQRWNLLDIVGSPLRTWDERGHEFQYIFDVLHRPLQTIIVGGDGPQPLNHVCERTFYGESEPDAKLHNLRGQAVRRYDTGGLLHTPEYDFKGQVLTSTRQLFADYKDTPHWIDANLNTTLEPETHTTVISYDALGRVTTKTMPDTSVVTTTYNRTGLLETETLKSPEAALEVLVTDADYNEKGQRRRFTYGSGVTTTFTYDRQTFRLIRLVATAANSEMLQDLHYTYDAAGNVTHLKDSAVPITFFNNQLTTGLSTYTYDAVYRLVQATGRENNAALAFATSDNWQDTSYKHQANTGDPMSVRTFTEHYTYDAAGNMTELKHQASGNNWTRQLSYQADSDRLSSSTVGGTMYSYTHDAIGAMSSMPHLADISWNFKEELVKTIRQQVLSGTPEATYYQYDSSGERLRKITERAADPGETPVKKDERLYIGDFELYKMHSGTNSGLQRGTIRAIDDEDRCYAMIETRNNIDDGSEQRLVRYQLHNQLGSTAMELDSSGKIINYEEYHPFGTTAYQTTNAAIKSTAKRYRFSGKERDEETGFYYHGARYLCPWLGRWTSCDPLGIATHSNSYMYVSNNPIRLKDDDGQAETDTSNVNTKKLASSNKLLNKHVNDKLKQVRRAMGIKPGMTLTHAQRREFVERVAELGEPRGAGVWSTIKSGATRNAKYNKSHIEKWASKHLPTKAAGDRYKGAGLGIGAAWWTGSSAVNPSIVVESNFSTFANSGSGKIPIGTDKLGHFFGQGYEYYEIYESTKGTEHKRHKAAIAYGESTERGKFGLGTTGVYSYADLEANWSGFNFYKKLYDDPFMTFDIGDYVHEDWNEQRNHNYHSKAMLKHIVSNFISKHPATFGAMVKKYLRAWAHHPYFSGNMSLAKRTAREELGRMLQGRHPAAPRP